MNTQRAVILLACVLVSARASADDVFEEIESGQLSAEPAQEEASPEAASAPAPSGAPDAWAAFEETPRTRKVVVAEFEGKGALTLRQAVLDALSEHAEIEVIGAKDVAISAKSRSVSADDESGRALLSKELGIYAWVDAQEGVITLQDARGKQLAKLPAGSHRGSDSELRVVIWKAFGPHMSDAALRDHLVEALATSANGKLQALEALRVQQAELAVKRAERKAAHLAALKIHAESVLQEQLGELTRQQAVAVERQRKQQEELARQEEAARQQALAEQQALAQQQEAARKAELAQREEQARQEQLAQQQALAQQQRDAAFAQQQQQRDAAIAKQAAAGAVGAERWQGAQPVWQPASTQPVYAQPQPAYAQPQPAYVAPPQPLPQPASAQPAPVEPAEGAMPVSAATQAWLAKRRAQQQH